MTIAFPAYHVERFRTCADEEGLRDMVLDALHALGWRLLEDSDNPIGASVGVNFWSFGEKVEIRILLDNTLVVTSTCVMPTQCIDWGKNESNVALFIAELRKRAALQALAEPFEGAECAAGRDDASHQIQENRNRIK